MYLVVWVDELKAAHEEAISLGAKLLTPADDPGAAEGFQVYADSAGDPFCLCWGWLTPGFQSTLWALAGKGDE